MGTARRCTITTDLTLYVDDANNTRLVFAADDLAAAKEDLD